jgi:formylglycine-generating enzyme required for sulfatase activity
MHVRWLYLPFTLWVVSRSPNAFEPTIANDAPPPRSAPAGMAWIPGGEFSMGVKPSPDTGVGMTPTRDATPIHRVYVDGFFMDKTSVTNAQFAVFVRATGYVTTAERPIDEAIPPSSIVFRAPDHEVSLDDHLQWWELVAGADWKHPQGPRSDIVGKENFPVVHVSYDDAEAYARWAGKRLPTEAEWEFAARGGLTGKTFVWGDEMRPNGKWMANTHQGSFPMNDTAEDGFSGVAPVASFPPNGYGLSDMTGNVWQWTSDWYRPDYYEALAHEGVARNPRGPTSSLDPDEPTQPKRVHRGGSFLCSRHYCARYVVGTRGKGEPTTSTNHLGFRCVD